MELIISFESQYRNFLKENDSIGYCTGFCLTWLGDALKNRPVQVQKSFLQSWLPAWFTAWFISTPPQTPPQMRARIPIGEQEFQNFLERVKRRQINYSSRYSEERTKRRLPHSITPSLAVTVNFKNNRQRESEIKTGVPGLVYSYHDLDSVFDIQGLRYSGKPVGTIFVVTLPGSTRSLHAVATLSMSPEEIYYLDPNVGLFKVNHNTPRMDIVIQLARSYGETRIQTQIVIQRK